MSSLEKDPYRGYAYAYPHKTAYRPLDPPVPLAEAWRNERKDALFLYVHVPYCEMRCGFCNLFTRALPAEAEIDAYFAALRREAVRVRAAIGDASFARMAVGGGTPTFVGPGRLDSIFELAERVFGARAPASVETSPGTADAESLAVLAARGVRRVSIGIQTFDDAELAALGRPERTDRALAALERIRSAGFPVLNVDLIYGIPGQTAETWRASIRAALRFRPEEFYLYPLYVRPRTGLWRRTPAEDRRLELYRAGRDLLLEEGYAQDSMRMFRRPAAAPEGPVYCCQDDGMVGLGCGARSYTSDLHYSSPYAVSRAGVRSILAEYAATPDARFDVADYGVRLGLEDRQRRWIIKSLLRTEGLSLAEYASRFGTPVPGELRELEGLAVERAGRLVLTAEGLELSDSIGPWLYSPGVRERMGAFALR